MDNKVTFRQVAGMEEVRKFMLKEVKLARQDAESWDAEITDSTLSPFSDKLLMFHIAFLVNAALSYYGAAIGSSLRSDIILNLSKVFTHAMEAGYNYFTDTGLVKREISTYKVRESTVSNI